jgi:hypothetical protein
MFFNDFKMLTGRSIWINGSFSPEQNAIVTNQKTVNGITTQQYMNTNGNFNFWFYGSYGFKIKKADLNAGINLQFNGGRYVNFVNDLKNTINQQTTGLGIYANKYKENKYDFSINSNLNYNRSRSSITAEKNNFLTHEYNANSHVFITKKLEMGSGLNVYLRQKRDAFDRNNNIFVWDASISYKFFKKNNGVLKLEVNDILKQRSGYDRSFTGNQIYERNYNMLSRYGMLSFTWNFSKTPGATK